MCRNTYNNRLNQYHNNLIRRINNRLKKNWRILESLNPEKKCKTNKQVMEDQGFDFSLYTSTHKTKDGTVCYFVYNQGYLPLKKDLYTLIKKKELYP